MDRRSFIRRFGAAAAGALLVDHVATEPPPPRLVVDVDDTDLRAAMARAAEFEAAPAPPRLLAPLYTQGLEGARWVPVDPLGEPFHIYLDLWQIDRWVERTDEVREVGRNGVGQICWDIPVRPAAEQPMIALTVPDPIRRRMGSTGRLRFTHRADGGQGTIESLYHRLHRIDATALDCHPKRYGGRCDMWRVTFEARDAPAGSDPFNDLPPTMTDDRWHQMPVAYSQWIGPTDQ